MTTQASFSSATSLDGQMRRQPRSLREPHRHGKKMATRVVRPDEAQQEVLLGHFSFAPATQTTVVTTTTTTTTSFPPMIMNAPKQARNLDPKLYPLASSPTPRSIKELRFSVGGQPAIFREAENSEEAIQRYRKQQIDLKKANGTIQVVENYPPRLDTHTAHPDTPESSVQAHESTVQSYHKRQGPKIKSPVQGARSTPLSSSTIESSSTLATRDSFSTQKEATQSGRSSSRLQIVQTSTPITPSIKPRKATERKNSDQCKNESLEPSLMSQAFATPELDSNEFQQTLSPQPDDSAENPFKTDHSFSTDTSEDFSLGDLNSTPFSDAGLPAHGLNSPISSQSRPRPSALDTAAAQDASLPSPSLSPVTAAANLQYRRGYFDEAIQTQGFRADDDNSSSHTRQSDVSSIPRSAFETFSPNRATEPEQEAKHLSMMDIPHMIDTFDALPETMKTYLMYQLLRRCPKPLLHFVADNVNPALKCDFLSLLPLELCQNIIRRLDLKSLCNAAQVSKRWRHVIDSDEKAWKMMLDEEGYDLSPQELHRAILEGWGWQFAPELNSSEKDLSAVDTNTRSMSLSPRPSSKDNGDVSQVSMDSSTSPVQSRRSKRKCTTKAQAPGRKLTKKKDSNPEDIALFDTEALKRHIASTEGPYAAAQTALLAVPSANFGLPSLRSLHLHKSIFRRHHLISRNWMQDSIKPRHLAFKAHQRHVVTCLQFDGDKILTGSDDTNINVYDTRTGALRARLEGHEGGVWALQYVGNTLVSGSTDRSVRVWDINRGICTHIFNGHTSTVRCLIILMPCIVGESPSGKPIMMPKEPIIITGSRDSTLRIWKLPAPEEIAARSENPMQEDADSPFFLRALTGHMHSVRAIAAHGDTLVSGSYDSTVRVWKISTGETLHRLQGHNQKVYSVVLDHERNRCISGSMDNLVKVWSLDTGTVLFNLEGHMSLVGLLDLQRNYLVSAAADSTLRIWDPDTGQCKSILSAHTGAITCFQHDGRKVISGSDRNLKMWDIKTGEFERDLLKDLSGVWQVKFDEQRCVAAVQRHSLTYIEVLDFGASRDGIPSSERGRRIVVDVTGTEIREDGESIEMAEPRPLDG